jgi:hypothetical protein
MTGRIPGVNVSSTTTGRTLVLAFAPLFTPLNLAGRVVTVDAMHRPKTAARFVVGPDGHYLDGDESQRKLWNAALDAANELDLEHPRHESCTRGHGRIDRHRVWTALVSSSHTFARELLHHRRTRVLHSR